MGKRIARVTHLAEYLNCLPSAIRDVRRAGFNKRLGCSALTEIARDGKKDRLCFRQWRPKQQEEQREHYRLTIIP